MKICQDSNNKIFKRIISLFTIIFVLFAFSVSLIFFINKVSADEYTGMGGDAFEANPYGAGEMSQAINTSDPGAKAAIEKAKNEVKKGALERLMDQIKTWAQKEAVAQLKKAGDIAYKAGLKYFLNTLAFDTATYLATGDKGQAPMFITEGWGTYLKNVADSTAGSMIEAVGRKNGLVQFNLCQPNLDVMFKIRLGLTQTYSPKAPACTFSQLTKKWDAALKDKDFLPKFQDMFNPWSNDLGIALTLQTGVESQISQAVNNATNQRLTDQGFKPVTEPISGNIKTSAGLVKEYATNPIRNSALLEGTYTGSAIADAIDIFINTLSGKLLDKWLKKGLVTNFPSSSSGLTDIDEQNQAEGIAGAENRLRSLTEPSFKVRGDYDVLAELTICPDPNKAGPTNCVIDQKFREAIEKRLTVGQAMEQGYLSASGVFGFTSDGLEPKFNEGYPYRSMLILRKFRILPVGWEIAAQYIKDCQNTDSIKCSLGKVDGTKNLSDLVNCTTGWCANLVDPNWVLKAPQNFCAREGAGPEILSEQISGEGMVSSLNILRNDTYCADGKSLIKENSDGSNPYYGYCTEERRIWDFNGKTCEPRDNTCQTFSSTDGQTVSYLQNTLDFSVCKEGNIGCQKYATSSLSYDKGVVEWNENSGIYLNKNAETCDAADEGCHQFIRLNAGGGANLLTNPNFNATTNDGSWNNFGTASTTAYEGEYSLEKSSTNKDDVRIITVGTSDYSVAGESYVLSFYAKACGSGETFALGDLTNNKADLVNGGDWQRYNLAYTYPDSIITDTNIVKFSINSSSCLIDNIKLERGSTASNYSDYASGSSLIYQKLLPDYLKNSCYNYDASGNILNGTPIINALAQCNNYVRECKAEEVGCELYTNITDGSKIPGKVKSMDYCPAVCVGYDIFVQKETNFDLSRDAYFIPKTAKTCSAEASGCEQFTNLDEEAKGGEGIEYYTYLRQCLKKAGNEASCGGFYNWEGSDESGYQLKVTSLKLAGAGPAVTDGYDASLCTEDIYNYALDNPAYNPDCHQFYNRQGEIFYRLYSYTISCSDDCHPYRKTEPTSCAASTDCLGGGSCEGGVCIYMAVPGQGSTCSAAAAGCREYNGNTGNNVRNIFTDDFSGGTAGAWASFNNSMVEPSGEALTLDADNKGNSLSVNSSAQRPVGGSVIKGKAYVLSFVAKAAAGAVNLNISLATTTAGVKAGFAAVALTADWKIYKTNLTELNHDVSVGEILLLEAGQSFFIDIITLTEITDRYYLIKNSWNTPDVCYNDMLGEFRGSLYNLGCDQYSDRAGKTHYLKSFSELCPESGVGCELMIDTKNSSNPGASYYRNGQISNAGNSPDLIVPADSPIYLVYDQSKLCNADAKSCALLGKFYKYEDATLYGDIYLKNDPDKYNQILCGADAVGCEVFAYDKGEKYFKDPGDQVCEWRRAVGAGESYGWFKKKVKRCDDGTGGGSVNGEIDLKKDSAGKNIEPKTAAESDICISNSGCSTVTGKADIKCAKDADCGDKNKCVKPEGELIGACYYSCITDNNDYRCPTDENNFKTLGLGGLGGRVIQPGEDAYGKWAGICSAANSGCGEYIDPMSKFNPNIIFNGSFQKLAVSTTDGWSAGSTLTQKVVLEPNTVYRLARVSENSGSLKLDSCSVAGALREIMPDNSLAAGVSLLSLGTGDPNSKIFYYRNQDNEAASCTITAGNTGGPVELKQVVIDYQLAQNLDSTSCNGVPNFDKGCVLFNQRIQDRANLAALTWDADTTVDTAAPSSAGEKDSNAILKVAPDRTCDKWLACRSYVKDDKGQNICFDLGLCNAVDDNGNCSNFISSDKENQTLENLGLNKISNLSGYVKAGLSGGSIISDYYPFGAMEQVGEVANLANGGFEFYGSNLYPVGWTWSGQEAAKKSWDANVFSVINNPISAQAEGIGNAPEGRSFLKLGSSYDATSEEIDVMPKTNYIITAYVNTKNLKSGVATIDIVDNTTEKKNITQDLGNDWQFKVGSFTTGVDSRITIKLAAPGAGGMAGSEGNFYYDNITIRPALNSRDDWYTTQSCRLYPQSDSLSCDYYEDSGKRQKGWYGYCLEYDRPPGDPNVCLLWYPVDKVQGDGIEEGAGYLGKVPVYYCTKFKGGILVEARKQVSVSGSCSCRGYGSDDVYKLNVCEGSGCLTGFLVPAGYTIIDMGHIAHCGHDCPGGGLQNFQYGLAPIAADFIVSSGGYDWYKYNGDLQSFTGSNGGHWDESTVGLKLWIPETQELLDPKIACEQVVQVVTSVGQNKYWSSRVYNGSDYRTMISSKFYNTANTPYGSMIPPYPVNNPYEWDGIVNTDENKEIQPIYVKGSGANAGSPYSCEGAGCSNFGLCNISKTLCYNGVVIPADAAHPFRDLSCNEEEICEQFINPANKEDEIKRFFAQSYGNWQWSSQGVCEKNKNKSCSVGVKDQCPGGICGIGGSFFCSGGVNDGISCNPNLSCATCTDVTIPMDCYWYNGDDFGSIAGCFGSDRRCNDFLDVYSCQNSKIDFGYRCNGNQDGELCCASGDCLQRSVCSNNTGSFCDPNQSNECGNDGPCIAGGVTRYNKILSSDWGPPETKCPYTTRPENSTDYCAIPPAVSNIKVDNISTNVTLIKNGFVNLTFNTKVDSNQLPLTMYAIDWGDGEKTVVTGVEMRDRPDPDTNDPKNDGNPHSLYHLYSYWDLKAKANSSQCLGGGTCNSASLTCQGGTEAGEDCVDCSTAGQCKVKPRIKIKDNWGWYNKGEAINTANGWDDFGGYVVVKEK